MSKIKFTGIMPAMLTPLDANGKVIKSAVKDMADYMIAAGVDGFYTVGGTGEGVMINLEQRKAMAEAAIEAVAGRAKVIVHTGAVNSLEVLDFTRFATAAGADGISSVPPSIYFKSSFDQTVRFYTDMANNTNLPILIYANQTGAGMDMSKLLTELLKVDNICGAKDTRANYYAMWQLKQINNGDINVINGPDESLLCGLCMGADGGIGGTYAAMPELFVALYKAFKAGELDKARELQNRINRIIKVLLQFATGSVIPAMKELLKLKGIDAGAPTYPAVDFSEDRKKAFIDALNEAGYTW